MARSTRRTTEKRNIFRRIKKYIVDVKDEWGRVSKPSKEEVWKFNVVVIVSTAILAIYLGFNDSMLGRLRDPFLATKSTSEMFRELSAPSTFGFLLIYAVVIAYLLWTYNRSESPHISSITPKEGKVGGVITIKGRRFSDKPTIKFDTIRARQILQSTESSVEVRVPQRVPAGNVKVVVETRGGVSNKKSFTVA